MTKPIDSAIEDLPADLSLSPTDDQSRPNLTALRLELRDLGALALNVKSFGYELARAFAQTLPQREGLAARQVGLACKPSTQEDMESDWVAYWLGELGVPVVFHRKLWEYAYLLQALHENGALREGARGLGFSGAGTAAYAGTCQLELLRPAEPRPLPLH